ncbi:alpha/beta hydrolase [Roseovarius sp. EL26]|uniref:COG3904 family protein n=1 Tax=Roseovarius sp. EL26 TaxID=2126672 RepID=UPI000EA2C1EF|nr:alpha/beta hydrolase [Roseovarius sp. EL26]
MANFKILLLATAIVLGACASYMPAVFKPVGNALVIEGVIDADTLANLQQTLRENPEVNRLILQNVPGSADDESSLTSLGQFIRKSDLATFVPANGVVASGGTDMVAMGKVRIIAPGACVGVHTWAEGGLLGADTGADLPRNDPRHQMYLSFYQEMGIPEEFYWFTLNAAGADDVHWMTKEEINRYRLSTVPVKGDSAETREQREQRCYARL